MRKLFALILLAGIPLFGNEKLGNEYYTRKSHYLFDGITIFAFTGFATTANLMKSAGANQNDNLAISSLVGIGAGALGFLIFQSNKVRLKKSTSKIVFPIVDGIIHGVLGFYSGALIGETVWPQGERDLSAGAILGALIGGVIGIPSGSIIGYRLTTDF